jgi:hypothetical protein
VVGVDKASLSERIPAPCLPESCPDVPATLTTIALYDSSLQWLGVCSAACISGAMRAPASLKPLPTCASSPLAEAHTMVAGFAHGLISSAFALGLVHCRMSSGHTDSMILVRMTDELPRRLSLQNGSRRMLALGAC